MKDLYIVKTEGDCEGRTTQNLGIWEGSISDIALHLADKCIYSLQFEKVVFNKPGRPTKSEVSISSYNIDFNELGDDRVTNISETHFSMSATVSNLSAEEQARANALKILSKYSKKELDLILENAKYLRNED